MIYDEIKPFTLEEEVPEEGEKTETPVEEEKKDEDADESGEEI